MTMVDQLTRHGCYHAGFPALMVLAIAATSAALAQTEQVSDPAREQVRQLAAVALAQLRDDDLLQAMITLGETTDLAVGPLSEDDPGLAPVAAGWHRELVQRNAEERFGLLYEWSMPTQSRRTVRVLSTLVPHDAPPKAFALALSERPRDDSFPVAEINGVRGLFSTAWLLVTSAAECGRLRKLASELAPLAGDEVPNARFVLTLAEILRGERIEDLTSQLSEHAVRVESRIPRPGDGQLQIDPKDLVTAAACLGKQELVPPGERILKSLIEYTYGGESIRIRAFLRVAHATAVRNRLAGPTSDILDEPKLPLWQPCQSTTARLNAMGCVPATWLAYEDHVLHLAGPENSLLFYRYPLTGQFEFSCETQDGGWRGVEGGVEYGGLGFEAWGGGWVFKARDADLANIFEQPSPYVADTGQEHFHRLTIRSTDEGFAILSNGHPVWKDSADSQASPWLALRAFRDRRPVFRNLKLTGNPTIPREVHMSAGDVLRGWRAGYYGQQLPSPFVPANRQSLSRYEWYLQDGIIHGSQLADSSGRQTLLTYVRPLSNGESVSYDFLYRPDEFEVHPALGRLAFLIEPNGVRVHWMTDGERDWTGLPEENAIVEPLNRRGPKPLPLTEGEWQRVSMTLANDKITLTLNGATIYERIIEPEDARTFGFYRDRTRSAQIRDVVMRGDWPERLSDEELNNLLAISGERTIAERLVLHDLIEEQNLAANLLEVRNRAIRLEEAARFDYLSDWVMPGKSHPGFRLAGDFTPTNPAPIADASSLGAIARRPVSDDGDEVRIQSGGELVSPALDLIDLAKKLGSLDKLRAQIESTDVSPDDGHQQRARLALLYLVDIARDDAAAAQSHLEQLFDAFQKSDHIRLAERWPETLAMSRGVHYPATREVMAEFLNLLNDMYRSNQRDWRSAGTPAWDSHFFSWAGTHKYYESGQGTKERFTSPPGLRTWASVSYATSKSRGNGYPRSHWQLGDKQADKLSGHEIDYLMYCIPLRGNYEVECDLATFNWRDTQILVAGSWISPNWERMSYELGTFRDTKPRRELTRALGRTDEFCRVRAVVRDGVCTTYYDGRRLHEEPLPAEPGPWLAIRNWSRFHGGVRDVRISGDPIIPEQINLATAADLPGWFHYFEDTVGTNGDWRHDNDRGIIGIRKAELAGTLKEGLLCYHRPMLEDGTIEYEFFYQPGQVDAHPALDRVAFMLEPEGVRIHWVTDGKYDRTGADPANRFTETENRRGPDRLPLKVQDWNRLRLTLRRNNASLELNGQLIYDRALEPTNQRMFGLFHYADQTEMRVRNIVWRGDWPRTLPVIAQQELAAGTDFLDQRLPELTAVFEHDFAKDGLPEKYFRMSGQDASQHISVTPEGVQVVRPSGEDWVGANIHTRLRARGDFDIIAVFDKFEPSAESQDAKTPLAASISLLTALSGQGGEHCKLIRRLERDDRHVISYIFAATQPNGTRRDLSRDHMYESRSGRFRLARRGDQIYFLFAESDSPTFRLITTETASTEDTDGDGLRLDAIARGTGRVSVIWRSLTVRAEQLMHTGEPQSPVLFVMRSDGREVRQLTKPIGDLGSHGSPAWSPDGKRIAFDTYNGSTASSHIVLINADGTELKDLGIGSMPTFSPDGKRIAFSWSGRGITIMDADGRNREILDPSGWGAQWSPDGKTIAYSGNNITLFDLATRRQRVILEGEQAARYSFIYWNMSWSRDARRICFKGRTRIGDQYEIGVADAGGSSRGFKVLYASETEPQTDFAWYPQGNQILCSMHHVGHGGQRLFTLDANAAGPPKLLPTQPLDQENLSSDWSPDGRYIVFSSRPPLEWKTLFETDAARVQEAEGARQ